MSLRADPAQFEALDLRCHELLADVGLHDVWAIPLSGGGAGRTMLDVNVVSPLRRPASNPVVRRLVALRFALGRQLRWDEEPEDPSRESYLRRLTEEDRSRSLVSPGTREGAFRTLYVFSGETLAEVRNATVHAFLASALIARGGGYLLYWAIYVKPVGPMTRVYMAVIDPFRRLIVYPALIRQLQVAWSCAYPEHAATGLCARGGGFSGQQSGPAGAQRRRDQQHAIHEPSQGAEEDRRDHQRRE
jgi:hypothetical protein